MKLTEVQTLLLFPLKPERKHFLSGLREKGIQIQESKNGFWWPEKKAFLAIGGHGKTEFGVRASKLLSEIPSSKRLLCLGVSGGLATQIKPLDVVIGKSTTEHDYKLGFGSESGLPIFQSELFEKLKPLKTDGLKFDIHTGSIASGDEDVITRARANEIREQTNTLCVAWEGAGGARAARVHEVDFLEVRAISDICDENVESQFKQNLPKAMSNLSEVIADLI